MEGPEPEFVLEDSRWDESSLVDKRSETSRGKSYGSMSVVLEWEGAPEVDVPIDRGGLAEKRALACRKRSPASLTETDGPPGRGTETLSLSWVVVAEVEALTSSVLSLETGNRDS